MSNTSVSKTKTTRAVALGILSLGTFFGGYAASAATIPQGDITFCVNKKSGVVRQVAKCSTSEKSVSIQGGGNGEIKLITKHIFPASTTSATAMSAECPTSTPLFLGVTAFIPKPSNYFLGEIDDRGVQSILKVGPTPGRINYSSQNSTATLRITTPLSEKLEIYTITSCANPKTVTTITY